MSTSLILFDKIKLVGTLTTEIVTHNSTKEKGAPMEAYRIMPGTLAVQDRTNRIGLVLETNVIAGGILVRWQDTGDEETIPAHTILRTHHKTATEEKDTPVL